MARSRIQTLLALGVLAVGLLIAFIAGLFVFMTMTARTLHPDPDTVPSAIQSPAPPRWAETVERARGIARQILVERNLPGLSVAVGIDGDLVWAEGFGYADLENQIPVAPDTRFKLGMASKVLTSAAAGRLLEDGRLNLDAEIQTYVPQYPRKEWPMTLRQVMGHLAGIRDDAGDEGPWREHCDRTIDGLRLFADYDLRFEPGTRYDYSSYGWILVSAAVEAAAGEPFLRFMQRQIFEPLGMDNTRPDSATEPIPDRALFYFPRFAADPRYGLQEPTEIDHSCFAGAAVFLSTPADLVRFGIAIESGKLLRPETVGVLQTSQRLPSGTETGYGLGWDIETVELSGAQQRVVGHDGDVAGGVVASLWIFPPRRIVVAALSNTAFADTFSIATRLIEVFAADAKTARQPPPPAR